MEKGGNIPTVYNAANEKAVSLFLDRKISYPEITELIEACMENAEFIDHPDVDEILGTEAAAFSALFHCLICKCKPAECIGIRLLEGKICNFKQIQSQNGSLMWL